MQIGRLRLDSWMSFRSVDLALDRRVFVVGPNASGKSNLLDAIRFLRDVAVPGGGLQRALRDRGGLSAIRSAHSRRSSSVVVEVELRGSRSWRYRLELGQDSRHRPLVKAESVEREGVAILERPDREDRRDPKRLSQTCLEQVSMNRDFREVARILGGVRYLHLVPQMMRAPERVQRRLEDPFGSDFAEQLARVPKRTLAARLRKIDAALQIAIPQLQQLRVEADESGQPALQGHFAWRPGGGWQDARRLSDGTLRLIGLLWAMLDGEAPLLLEEPELSLHPAVIRYLPAMMITAGRKAGRQVVVTTHSPELLSDESIAPEDVVLLEPSADGTTARPATERADVRALIEAGIPIGDAVIPAVAPQDTTELALFAAG